MKKMFLLLAASCLLLFIFGCGTTTEAATAAAPASSPSDDDFSNYLTVPERSDNHIFTVYTGYTFSSKKMSEEDWDHLALVLILGYEYCASYAGSADMLAVGFLMDNNTCKVYIAGYNDYMDFINGKIDADTFLTEVSIEDLDL